MNLWQGQTGLDIATLEPPHQDLGLQQSLLCLANEKETRQKPSGTLTGPYSPPWGCPN